MKVRVLAFDGDEMNAHCPQSLEAAVELEDIAAVPNQIITPRHGKPAISIVQDTLLGSYRICRDGVTFNRREFMDLMVHNKRFTGVLPPPRAGTEESPRWTGQQVLSMLLPPINMEMKNKLYDDQPIPQNFIKIKNGVLEQGIIDKDVYSKPSKGIIHTTYNDYGPQQTVELIDSLQNTVSKFLVLNGFSVGISDLIADEGTRAEMEERIMTKKRQIAEIILQVHLDLFDNNTGNTNQHEFESRVLTALNEATNESGKIGIKSLADDNRLMSMIRSGSKGGPVNVSQMMACVGQQNIENKRIPYGFQDRTLPHYKKYDDSAEARGFIESSFIRGLTPQEFFFHAMSGREGLIDTAVKTADTGYIQRQMVKGMEDLLVQHDGTVRDAGMNIVQFAYGEDGINATKIEAMGYPLGKMTRADIDKEFGLEGVDLTAILQDGVERGSDAEALKVYKAQVLEDRRILVEQAFNSGRQGGVYGPVNLERVIDTVKVRFGLQKELEVEGGPKQPVRTDLTPAHVIAGIEKLITKTQTFSPLWSGMLRFYLSPQKMIEQHRFTKAAFDTMCEVIVTKNWQSWVVPGEQVGILAAQSIGEPSTQMVLNSVDYRERIIISRNGRIMTPMIGEFIDNYYESIMDEPEKVQHLPNDQIYINLDDGADWKALSTDADGKMQWTRLEAITRHPVINADGTDNILKVTLASGRTVRATKAESFLTVKDGKIVTTRGSDLVIGDTLPVASTLALESLGLLKEISVRDILPAKEYIYGSEMVVAKAAMEAADAAGERHWFTASNGCTFTVPYGRSDGLRTAFEGRNTNEFRSGCVYPKRTRPDISHIPETISLDAAFGFFCGAYVAEGCSNATQVCITNNDAGYLDKVEALMAAWNVGTHRVGGARHAATGISGTTNSLIVHSTILAKLMSTWFGATSYVKTFPDWALQADTPFIQGLIDGYFSGDGTVSATKFVISATTVSETLANRLQTLLARFGIFTKIRSHMPEQGLFKSVSRAYTLSTRSFYSQIFANNFTLSVGAKQERINTHMARSWNNTLETLNNTVLDPIVAIEECSPLGRWVYDVTVEGTRNFTLLNALCQRDTFHLAGVASKSNVTGGLPRLKELLKVTQNPKATSLTIYLKKEHRQSKEKAREVSQQLELTMLRDITLSCGIYYDPKDEQSVKEEDRDLLAFYRLYEQGAMAEQGSLVADSFTPYSPWILRLELNREKMFDRNISMYDIAFVLRDKFPNCSLVYSDYNAQKLVMRIRVPPTAGMDSIADLKRYQNKLLSGVILRGAIGLKSVAFRKDETVMEEQEGAYAPVTQYILDTDGSNFLEVMNHPAVDGNKLYSTNVHDLYEQYGIEVARAGLLKELTIVFEEAGVNIRHLGLLVDVMTRSGRLMSMDRYGINKRDIGPLAKASFEETGKILLKASLFGEVDPVTGVSANIMTGQPIRGGTAFSQIIMDETAVVNLYKGLPPAPELDMEDETDFAALAELEDPYGTASDVCSAAKFQMSVQLPPVSAVQDEDDITLNIMQA